MSRLRSTIHNINIHSEKGLPLPASSSSHISPRPRRRRLICFFILVLITCVFLSRRSDFDELIKSKPLERFTKDGIIKVPLPHPSEHDVDKQITDVLLNEGEQTGMPTTEQDKAFIPTDALRKLANTLHIPVPPSGQEEIKNNPAAPFSGTSPSYSDRVLLLLNAVKSKTYSVPSDLDRRLQDLQPKTSSAFSHALSLFRSQSGLTGTAQSESETNIDDARLYLESHDAWLSKHRKQSPLTVFSKSYCPFSKKAKELLTKMGAQFDLYEVDLRSDAEGLQNGLREISGHSTFPTIFVQDTLIGGSDDLVRLESTGVLRGILEGAGVQFKAATNAESGSHKV